MNIADRVLIKLHSIFSTSKDSVLYAILKSISDLLANIDPIDNDFSSNFSSITKSSGKFLDLHGKDLDIPRKIGEADKAYRDRLLSAISTSALGPTMKGMKALLKVFTGYEPYILELGYSAFTMGDTTLDEAIFIPGDQLLDIEITIQNPNGVVYNRRDLEKAVKENKPAFCNITIIHNGGV